MRYLVMRYLALIAVGVVFGVSSSFAQGHMGSPREQAACRRDAAHFCRHELGDDGAVQACLQQNRPKLSRNCQSVFASHGM
jgi:Cysteine rich repeat